MEGIICQKKGYLLQLCFVQSSGQKQNSDIVEKKGAFLKYNMERWSLIFIFWYTYPENYEMGDLF